MPPSIQERLEDIEKMCAKLREAETKPRGFLRLGATALVAGIGGGYAWRNYESRGWLYKIVQDERRRQRLRSRSSLYAPSITKTKGKARKSGSSMFDL